MPVHPGLAGRPRGRGRRRRKCAAEIGFPVILKASAGGGGRGMRIVRAARRACCRPSGRPRPRPRPPSACPTSTSRSTSRRPRHIEIQVMADTKGNVVHLGERECSIQRRHQKLIEEAPVAVRHREAAPARWGRPPSRRRRAVQYMNAGTIEFLLDADGNFYFMEMNTRIQVEHGVTELVTGRDLVKEQILVAAGEPPVVRAEGHHLRPATPSSAASTPRIPTRFVPSPGHHPPLQPARAARACAWTPSPTRAARSRPTTTA